MQKIETQEIIEKYAPNLRSWQKDKLEEILLKDLRGSDVEFSLALICCLIESLKTDVGVDEALGYLVKKVGSTALFLTSKMDNVENNS